MKMLGIGYEQLIAYRETRRFHGTVFATATSDYILPCMTPTHPVL